MTGHAFVAALGVLASIAIGCGGSGSSTAGGGDGGGGGGDAGNGVDGDHPDSRPPADGASGCSSNADCTSDFECSPGGVTLGCGACEMPQYPCNGDSDCQLIGDAAPPQPMVCGSGGECTCPVGGKTGSCIPACKSASDCGPDEACSGGHCVPKPCTSDSECPSNQSVDYACSAGVCATKSCKSNADCGAHFCVNNTCYPQAGVCTPPAA